MTIDTDDSDPVHRQPITRRAMLATLSLVAAAGRASADTALGGNPSGSASADYRYGAWSLAPQTLPPEGGPVAWMQRDAQTGVVASDPALPQTVSANGLQWSFANDLATAESNVTQTPAIAVGPEGLSPFTDGAYPKVIEGDGIQQVIASDQASAESARTQRPAVTLAQAEQELGVYL